MKRIYSLLLCAATLLGAVSCDSTDNDPEVELGASNIYVLNSGSWGSNNATLTSYDIEAGTTADDIFASQNGQGLGDTAQDMLVFDEQIYISVYGSGVIFVTDLSGTIITTITDDTYFLPRYFASDDDYVYVSYYDGGVAKIDPSTNTIVAKAAVSINPEQLVASNGNLYITISQGYGNYNACNTIDVYSTSTMTYTKSIEVILNPTQIAADSAGNLYVLSMGDYYLTLATLQKIDTAGNSTTLSISNVDNALPSAIVMGKSDVLYVLEGTTNSSYTMDGDVYAYDTTTGAVSTFITDGTTITDLYSISTDKTTGEVYVGRSDYWNTGDMYVFNADGTLNTTIGTGINPMKAISVAIEE